MSTLRHQLANLISVPLTMMRLSVKKFFYPKNIYFSGIERFSPGVVVDNDRKSVIKFGKRVSIHSRGRFVSREGGVLTIGDCTSFNVGCIAVCRKKIEIGRNVSFGPNVMLYDHNHIMKLDEGVKNTPFTLKEVVIGDNSWIGAGTIILPGANIGKNCIVAAGSIVKGNVPDNTVLIQKKENTYIPIG